MNENILLVMLKAFESKLKEFMSPADFRAFSAQVARDAFREEVEGMADSEFKTFILDNFDKITGDDFDA